MKQAAVLGIDIGGTNLRMALVTPDQEVHNPTQLSIASLREQAFLPALLQAIDKMLSEHAHSNVQAIGIGIPGIVNRAGFVLSCPNLPELNDTNLKTLLEDEFRVPAFVEKDTSFLLWGDYVRLRQDQPDLETVLGCYIGTGFGLGMILEGKIYRGKRGFAGEIGHIPIKDHHERCTCGSSGCLELYGGGKALVDYSSHANQRIEAVFLRPENASFVKGYLDYLAVGIATLNNLIDPELIVIGGGVTQADGFPLDQLIQASQERFRSPIQVSETRFVKATGGTFGGCLGAGLFCFNELD